MAGVTAAGQTGAVCLSVFIPDGQTLLSRLLSPVFLNIHFCYKGASFPDDSLITSYITYKIWAVGIHKLT